MIKNQVEFGAAIQAANAATIEANKANLKEIRAALLDALTRSDVGVTNTPAVAALVTAEIIDHCKDVKTVADFHGPDIWHEVFKERDMHGARCGRPNTCTGARSTEHTEDEIMADSGYAVVNEGVYFGRRNTLVLFRNLKEGTLHLVRFESDERGRKVADLNDEGYMGDTIGMKFPLKAPCMSQRLGQRGGRPRIPTNGRTNRTKKPKAHSNAYTMRKLFNPQGRAPVRG